MERVLRAEKKARDREKQRDTHIQSTDPRRNYVRSKSSRTPWKRSVSMKNRAAAIYGAKVAARDLSLSRAPLSSRWKPRRFVRLMRSRTIAILENVLWFLFNSSQTRADARFFSRLLRIAIRFKIRATENRTVRENRRGSKRAKELNPPSSPSLPPRRFTGNSIHTPDTRLLLPADKSRRLLSSKYRPRAAPCDAIKCRYGGESPRAHRVCQKRPKVWLIQWGITERRQIHHRDIPRPIWSR